MDDLTGHRASDEAMEKASTYGFPLPLPEGYTFVQEYRQNDGAENVPKLIATGLDRAWAAMHRNNI